jgi:hypothetical protein
LHQIGYISFIVTLYKNPSMKNNGIILTALITIVMIFNSCTKVDKTERLEDCGNDKSGHKLYYEDIKGCYYINNFGDKEAVLLENCTCKTKQ